LKVISKILERIKKEWEHSLIQMSLEEFAEEIMKMAEKDLEEEKLIVPALKWIAVDIREGFASGVRRQRYLYP
jgi:hypothetical protein